MEGRTEVDLNELDLRTNEDDEDDEDTSLKDVLGLRMTCDDDEIDVGTSPTTTTIAQRG